jgi:hypothetical protein
MDNKQDNHYIENDEHIYALDQNNLVMIHMVQVQNKNSKEKHKHQH